MTDLSKLTRKTDWIAVLMRDSFGTRTRDLARLERGAGRRLPRAVRHDLRMLADAEQTASNPKLAPTLDYPALYGAADRVIAHLRGIDAADRRKGTVLRVLGAIAFNLIVVFALLIGVLVWRGYL
ncbi:MAG: hypothetical protein NXH82_05255 [Rhodobacteraceae bacterium]|nr:hypothetical protein [Paracoccaceae bacterium]